MKFCTGRLTLLALATTTTHAWVSVRPGARVALRPHVQQRPVSLAPRLSTPGGDAALPSPDETPPEPLSVIQGIFNFKAIPPKEIVIMVGVVWCGVVWYGVVLVDLCPQKKCHVKCNIPHHTRTLARTQHTQHQTMHFT